MEKKNSSLRDLMPEEVPEYKHVMLDLETIGNDYDGIFTTIGAVQFDPVQGMIGRTFYMNVNWESAVAAGRTITPGTIKWWMQQEPAALAEIIKDGEPLEHVLRCFAEWFPADGIVWGKGPNFDVGKLEHAFGYYSIPWKFRNIRCVRTILDEDLLGYMADIPLRDFERTGTYHNALDDAINQARQVCLVAQALRTASDLFWNEQQA